MQAKDLHRFVVSGFGRVPTVNCRMRVVRPCAELTEGNLELSNSTAVEPSMKRKPRGYDSWGYVWIIDCLMPGKRHFGTWSRLFAVAEHSPPNGLGNASLDNRVGTSVNVSHHHTWLPRAFVSGMYALAVVSYPSWIAFRP